MHRQVDGRQHLLGPVAGRSPPVTDGAQDRHLATAPIHGAPLEALGQARCETAIRTLAALLDEQGSVARTARRLHLHRNAVTCRIRRITEALGVDLGDAGQP